MYPQSLLFYFSELGDRSEAVDDGERMFMKLFSKPQNMIALVNPKQSASICIGHRVWRKSEKMLTVLCVRIRQFESVMRLGQGFGHIVINGLLLK